MDKDKLVDEVAAWCEDRAAKLLERSNSHINAGKSIDDPDYRVLLGEHRAYLAVRSFIHGAAALRSHAQPK